MAAIMTRPKVSDNPRVKAAASLLADLKRQRAEVEAEISQLRAKCRDDDGTTSAALAILDGTAGSAEASLVDRIPELVKKSGAMLEAIRIQEGRLQNISVEIVGEFHAAAQQELDDRLVAVADFVNSTFAAIEELEDHCSSMAEVGAKYGKEKFSGVLIVPSIQAYFRLPLPSQVATARNDYASHLRRHLPNVAKQME